ncbi:MAG: bifunctional metallophosphatase/5'-nucleotidase [Spirochaetaceae bacterium]|nr:bifunctional metallophosphatase/5'-nucleotidase [Spirochaetaceae bacterium]
MNKGLKALVSILAVAMLVFSLVGFTGGKARPNEDIVILYTNDIHCGIEDGFGFAGLAALKKDVQKVTPYVTLVDNGDAVQGTLIGTISKGSYIVDIMNEVGYDFATLGNHEFDYGMDVLDGLIAKANAKYLVCNIEFTGKNKTFLDRTAPYAIKSYGNVKVAFVGVTTPNSITSSTPAFFQEDGEFVYDLSKSATGKKLFYKVQNAVNAARGEGADYVILLSHTGVDEQDAPCNSVSIIANTVGIDAVLDGHSHSVIQQQLVKNKYGEEVILTSTGTKFANIGKLTISKEGKLYSQLINPSLYDKKDAAITKFIDGIKASYEAEVMKVVAKSDVALKITDSTGVRMVRNSETAIGNLCADAYRAVAQSDIAMVNGGGIRANLPLGDITYADIINVHPFGNILCKVKTTGQQILDCLEFACRSTRNVYKEGQKAVGESGGFQHVSGLKFTIDTSVPSSVVTDEKGMFAGVTGARRVKDVLVEKDGKWVPIDPKATYTLASHNYMLKQGGDGFNMFQNDELLIDEGMIDNQVLMTYIVDILEGNLKDKYADIEGRITIK